MPAEPFERDTTVRVRASSSGHAWVRARVLVDLGGEDLVVARSKPQSSRRVRREDVRLDEQVRPPSPRPEAAEHDLTRLHCIEGPAGRCAVQRQSKPPTRAEMAEGQWSMCSTWLTSRSAPQVGEPSCPRCRTILGMEKVT